MTTWTELEDIMLSEISQTEKDKHHVISLICGTKNKQTHRYRQQVGGCQRQGVGEKWVKGGQKVQTPSYTINKLWRCNVSWRLQLIIPYCICESC